MVSVAQKDTTFTKIFVGGLPYHTTDDTLRKFFERFGEIDEAVVITDRATGKSRGYGFVTMSCKEAAQEAIKDPNPVIDGRKANVNLAYLGAKPRTSCSLTNSAATNQIIHLGTAYPTLQHYGLQPLIYPANTFLPNLLQYGGHGTSISPSTTTQPHYTNIYEFGNQYPQTQLETTSASFQYGNSTTSAALLGSQTGTNPANINYAYAALAQQAIAAGTPSCEVFSLLPYP